MSLFDSPLSNDTRFLEGIVTAVDAQRKVCIVRTIFGQSLTGVTWASTIPGVQFRDRVYVSYATGSPIVIGIVPTVGSDSEFATNIDNGALEADTGNYSALSRGVTNDPDKPQDLIAGDQVIRNDSGALFGLLRGGSIIAKASRLAQIFITRYDDLVRIVARNYELFTDVCEEVIANVRGRAYRYVGYGDTVTNARANVYKYQESYGDTVLAENLKGNYYGYNPTTFAALPAANDIIRKQWVVNSSGQILMKDELHLTGEQFSQYQDPTGATYTYVDRSTGTFDVKTLNGTYAQITTTPTSIILTYNNSNIVTINSSKIECKVGSNTITIDSSKIEGTFGTNKVTVDNTKAQLSANSLAHFVTVDSSGVHLG